MDDDLLTGLPNDLPSFVARFGSDAQCRDYLFGRAGQKAFAAPAAATSAPTATSCG